MLTHCKNYVRKLNMMWLL